MERRAWGWLGPVSGILFVAFLVAAVAIGEGDPGVDPNDPAERIARRLAADSDENKLAFPLYGLAIFSSSGS